MKLEEYSLYFDDSNIQRCGGGKRTSENWWMLTSRLKKPSTCILFCKLADWFQLIWECEINDGSRWDSDSSPLWGFALGPLRRPIKSPIIYKMPLYIQYWSIMITWTCSLILYDGYISADCNALLHWCFIYYMVRAATV